MGKDEVKKIDQRGKLSAYSEKVECRNTKETAGELLKLHLDENSIDCY